MRARARILAVTACLAAVAPRARAIDPGIVEGALVCDGLRHEMLFVQAVEAPGHARTLWVWVTDAAVAMEEARSPTAIRARIDNGHLHGARLDVSAKHPDKASVRGAVFAGPAPMVPITLDPAGARWDRVLVGEHRVVGKLRLAPSARGPDGCAEWSLEVRFSAPVFSGR